MKGEGILAALALIGVVRRGSAGIKRIGLNVELVRRGTTGDLQFPILECGGKA